MRLMAFSSPIQLLYVYLHGLYNGYLYNILKAMLMRKQVNNVQLKSHDVARIKKKK